MGMQQRQPQQASERKQRWGFRNIWEFIVKLIIIAIIIGWFIYQLTQGKDLDPISLIILIIIFIILLLLMIVLIWRQRHWIRLRCNLTAPTECVHGDSSILPGMVLEPVIGGAYGLGFDHYIIELRDPGGTLLSNVIVYPDGSGNPDPSLIQGSFAVASGTLGWIDVHKAVVDAGSILLSSTTFEITLRVFGVDGSELSPPCTITFDVSVVKAFINRVSTPWSVDYTDPNEPLRLADDPTADLATVGAAMHVRGSALISGCAGENIQEYTIWAMPDPTFSFAQPPNLSPATPGGDWVQVANVQFTGGGGFTADQQRASNVLDGTPDPDILTNSSAWGTRQECIYWNGVPVFCWTVPDLKASAFNSNAGLLPHKLDPSHVGGTGKFTFLLQVIDTAGREYYDVQRAWVDNEPIHEDIQGIAGLAACTDLYTKDSAGAFKTVDIEGTAWDELIDLADSTTPTSDNFHHYVVYFKKQGAAGSAELVDSPSPVPARPNPVGVGTLTTWDLESVDATSNPMGLAPDQLLADGEECTYNIILKVKDWTIVNEHARDYSWVFYPIKLINSAGPGP